MENYKELYSLSKDVFKEEVERFKNLEEKASNYLSVLTLLLGVAGYFINWLLNSLIPPQNLLDVMLLGIGSFILLSLLVAWFSVFSALKSYKVMVIPLNQAIIDFFDTNKMVDVYYYLSVQMKDMREVNRKRFNQKGRWLNVGYNSMRVSVICLIIFGVVFTYYKWQKPQTSEPGVTPNVTAKP